jgi:hypothetical protein
MEFTLGNSRKYSKTNLKIAWKQIML